ncbi:hypothetical protein [Gaiella sp.]|jgi:hypothetical protein|uniref:hypothetical protein n=1 Tax=Gaiella sp. TaxID=2663207 RepID=UPI002E342B14|nr:hypothetical protein [Gaiella sp.]HEX5584092.1 hypothetical protein [Gaiella sp.]
MKTVTGERTQRAVVSWRRTQLARAGFPLSVAARLARDQRFDLHALLELVDRGCPPTLAARILAPLVDDDEDRAA